MPSTVFEVDFLYGLNDWQQWPRPTAPPLVTPPWAGTGAFWERMVNGAPVNLERTAALKQFDTIVSARSGGIHFGWTSGTPWQIVDDKTPRTPVGPMNEPWWPFWTLSSRVAAKTRQVPLPAVVRRENDPTGGGDSHGIFYNPGARKLTECISLIKQVFGGWQASNTVEWDTSKPWEQTPGGVIAIQTPVLPMLPTFEEFQAGRIPHALLYVGDRYSPEFVGPARASDGQTKGHPLRGGDRIRLPVGTHQAYSGHDRTLCLCLEEFGAVVSDVGQFAGFRMPQDSRLESVRFAVALSQFEVVN